MNYQESRGSPDHTMFYNRSGSPDYLPLVVWLQSYKKSYEKAPDKTEKVSVEVKV